MSTSYHLIRRLVFRGLIIILLCLFAACDISSNLFSSSEKSELFSISANRQGIEISDGAILLPGTILAIVPKILNGTESSLTGLTVEFFATNGGEIDSETDAPKDTVSDGLSLLSGKQSNPKSLGGGRVFSASFIVQERAQPRSFDETFKDALSLKNFIDAAPEIKIPAEIVPGAYRIRMVLYDKTGSIADKTLEVFFAEGQYSVRGISIYPPSIEPGTFTVLKAQLSYPEGTDPYLVWRGEGTTIAYGILSEGFDQTLWSVPSREGIYTVSLDLYPFPPADSIPYEYGSSSLHAAKIVVARAKESMRDEFGDAEKFLRLFHFWGDFLDSGRMGSHSITAPIGKPELKIYGNSYGFAMGKGNGFEADGLALPSFEGKLQAFTFMARFQVPESNSLKNRFPPPEEIASSGKDSVLPAKTEDGPVQIARSVAGMDAGANANGSNGVKAELSSTGGDGAPAIGSETKSLGTEIAARSSDEAELMFFTRSKDETVSFGVYIDQSRSVYAEFLSDGQIIRTSSTVSIDLKPHDLYLSVIPGDDHIDFLWFLDGSFLYAERIDGKIGHIPGEGMTLVAGEKGFQAIYDEIGIFCELDREGQGSPYDGAFEFSAKKRYRQDFVFAEGFDGTKLREEIQANPEALPELGSLTIGPKSYIQTYALSAGLKHPVDVALPFQSENAQAVWISLFAEDPAVPLASLSLAGELRYGTKKTQLTKPDGSLRFRLFCEAGKIYIGGDKEKTIELGLASTAKKIGLRLENQGKKPISIDYLLIVYAVEEELDAFGKAKEALPLISSIPKTSKPN